MLQSMTGFGSGEAESSGWRVRLEVKTVNHRYFEATVRIPSEMMALEVKLTALLREKLTRGKIYAVTTIERTGGNEALVEINWPLAEQLLEIMASMNDRSPIPASPPSMDNLLRLDGVLKHTRDTSASEEVWPVLSEAATKAAEALNNMRDVEGDALCRDMKNNLDLLAAEVKKIDARRELIPKEAREKLEKKLAALAPEVSIDPDRLAAEVAIIADRGDISEELSRLLAHIEAFNKTLSKNSGATGKRLDFLCQELLREVNTIGSKAADLTINASVISSKTYIERIREQVQNVL